MSVLALGDVVARRTFEIERGDLVRYAGASGDFNPIHYREDVATAVGLPGVIAHGMLTMGLAVQPVVDWLGDPARLLDYQVRFTRPVPVPGEGAATVEVTATVARIDEEARTARIDLSAVLDGAAVLGRAQAVVRTA